MAASSSFAADLDFLVLGVQPPMPPRLPADVSKQQMEIVTRQRETRLEYDRLLEQARGAQIPVHDHNRLFMLIGHPTGE